MKGKSLSRPRWLWLALPLALVLLGLVVVVVLIFLSNSTNAPAPNPSTAQSAPAGTGATLPYVEYQAEDAATNGTKIGPDRVFTHLPAEASGRMAVKLAGQGQFVEFTLTGPANSLVLRYSIPDTEDGKGLTAPLSLYINGVRKQDLVLTSKYGWFYGTYPFVNVPAAGTPHHFYDEVHTLLDEMPAGTKVRVQVDANSTAPWYVIDLADFEEVPPPLTMPAGYLSITDYGADPTGQADAFNSITEAINAAKSQGKGVWLPRGTFAVNGHIIVDNVTIRGAGMWYTTLGGKGVGVYGKFNPTPSQNVKLYDFAIFGEVMDRDDKAALNGIGGALGGGSVIQNIWIEHTKVGIWLDGPFSDLTVTGCRLRDLTADGLNFHTGISNAIVEQTQVRNSGDDGLAMWAEKEPDHDNIFRFNTIELPILANNIAIYGGRDNTVSDNLVSDTVTEGGGIHVGNRFKATALAGTTTIARNTLVRTGSYFPGLHFGVGAIWFYALDTPLSGNVNVSDLQIEDSTYSAIHLFDQKITNITFDKVKIDKTGTFAVQVQTRGSATFNNVTAQNVGFAGRYDCETGFTIREGAGNSGWNDFKCGFPTATPPPANSPTPFR
ncbi:MAG: right-handed parallel beta-helix repeat-containing protein [Chloroflexi bacterium]|nr:right-handed parallel beta-helix repeat-containing protein [Chloroflexota bacterium]OJV88134.1 MAG: hypothetical protein BGO39_08005 [Chloroflexi bacterium 54-19]